MGWGVGGGNINTLSAESDIASGFEHGYTTVLYQRSRQEAKTAKMARPVVIVRGVCCKYLPSPTESMFQSPMGPLALMEFLVRC